MILSLSSFFSFILHTLFLYLNSYKGKHTTIRTKTQNTIKRFETQNIRSHKPNESKTIKAKKPHFVGDREKDKRLWRKTHLGCMNYKLITLLSLFWHPFSMITFLTTFVAWSFLSLFFFLFFFFFFS